MKNLKQILFILLFISPLLALASGQQFIIVASFEFLLFIIFLAILWTLKINKKGKFIMLTIYILSTYLTLHFMDTGAYFENLLLTNVSIAIIPTVIVFVTYLTFKGIWTQRTDK